MAPTILNHSASVHAGAFECVSNQIIQSDGVMVPPQCVAADEYRIRLG